MSTTNIINPFTKPEIISEDITNEIKNIILNQFNIKGYIDFYETMNYIENIIKEIENLKINKTNYNNNQIIYLLKKAYISAFFCTNMIISTNDLDNNSKQEIINDMFNSLNLLKSDEKVNF